MQYERYGAPEVLSLVEVPVPTPGPGQVLVRVRATSVNLSDWEALTGRPAYARIGGLRRPARPVLGSDIAGVVESVGPGVTAFAPGDEVFGDNLRLMGGFAEFCVAPVSAMAAKPAGLSFVEASALPQSSAIALQGTQWAGPGTRMCVNGAGGGSGAFVIQLAKASGAYVTGVDNAGKQAWMRELGADEVIDYQADDWTRRGPFDLVLDLVAHRSVWAYRRALAPGGRYRCVGGTARTLLRVLTAGGLLGAVSGRSLGVLAVRQGPAHFVPMVERCLAGEVTIHVERTFGLDEVAEALAVVGAGGARGKVVVSP
ncbi:MAG: NAD(P)-dependent alcohol dehydrogenase [Nocardioidaceae bacterium]